MKSVKNNLLHKLHSQLLYEDTDFSNMKWFTHKMPYALNRNIRNYFKMIRYRLIKLRIKSNVIITFSMNM